MADVANGQSQQHASSSKSVILHYLGPPGTYSHQVALGIVPRLRVQTSSAGQSHVGKAAIVRLEACETIRDTLNTARKRSAERNDDTLSLALLPYENNSNGPVVDSYELLHQADSTCFSIVADAHLPVSHSLLATKRVVQRLKEKSGKENTRLIDKDDLVGLDVVSSHTQALGQCSLFLQKYCPDARLVETSSTGEAAKRLTQLDTEIAAQGGSSDGNQHAPTLHACISSQVCAQSDVYGLVELFGNIQNANGNTTRFLLCQVWPKDQLRPGDVDLEPTKGSQEGQRARRAKTVVQMCVSNTEASLLSDVMDAFAVQRQAAQAQDVVLSLCKIDRQAQRFDELDKTEHSLHPNGQWSSTYILEFQAMFAKSNSNGSATGDELEHSSTAILANQLESLCRLLKRDQVSALGLWID